MNKNSDLMGTHFPEPPESLAPRRTVEWVSPSAGVTVTQVPPPALDKTVELAEAIAKFKTPEMEKAFARFLELTSDPLVMVKPVEKL